jgi:hypothetical protein
MTEPTPSSDEWTIDEAWRYLVRSIARRDHDARVELLAALRSGRLPIKCNGNSMSPDYWEHLTIEIADEHTVVKPLHWGLEPGEYRYTVSVRDVRMLWPRPGDAPVRMMSGKDWVVAEITRMRAAGETVANKRKLSRMLAERMQHAPNVRRLSAASIRNRLSDWGCWPL